MTENKKSASIFRWAWPEFSLTLPGDFALGVLLGLQAHRAIDFTTAGLCVAILTGTLLLISIFCVYKASSVRSRQLGRAIGIYRLLAVSFFSTLTYKNGIPPQAVFTGIILAVYSASALRVGTERFNDPPNKLGVAAWWPSLLVGGLGIWCIARNFTVYGPTAPSWISIYMGAWLFLRTVYVSNAIKGWCSAARLFQAEGLLVRGTIPVQAIIFMIFSTGKPWDIVAAAFLAMAASALQTIACKILPTPRN